jgi:hypothetical protein
MALILNKSKALKPKIGKVIRHITPMEQKGIDMVKNIAKQFMNNLRKINLRRCIFVKAHIYFIFNVFSFEISYLL